MEIKLQAFLTTDLVKPVFIVMNISKQDSWSGVYTGLTSHDTNFQNINNYVKGMHAEWFCVQDSVIHARGMLRDFWKA